jgi:hypothetical protein
MGAVLAKTSSALTASSTASPPSSPAPAASSKPPSPSPAPSSPPNRPLPLAATRPSQTSPRSPPNSRPMIPPTWRGSTSSNLHATVAARPQPTPTETGGSSPHETKSAGDNPFAIAEALRHRMDQQYIESVKKAASDHASRIEQETKDAFADIETRGRAMDAAYDASRKRLSDERKRAQERHDKQMAINQTRLVEMLKAVRPRAPSPSHSSSPVSTPAPTPAPISKSAEDSEYNRDDNPPAPEFRRAPHLEQWFSTVLKLTPAMIISNTIDSLCRSAARKGQSPPSWIWKSLTEEKMKRYQLSFDHFKGVRPNQPSPRASGFESKSESSNFEFQLPAPSTPQIQPEWTPPTNLTPFGMGPPTSLSLDGGQGADSSSAPSLPVPQSSPSDHPNQGTTNVNPFESKMTTRGAILGVWGTSVDANDSPILGGFFNRKKDSTRTGARRRKREDGQEPAVIAPPARISVGGRDGLRGTKQTSHHGTNSQQLPSRLSSLKIAH